MVLLPGVPQIVQDWVTPWLPDLFPSLFCIAGIFTYKALRTKGTTVGSQRASECRTHWALKGDSLKCWICTVIAAPWENLLSSFWLPKPGPRSIVYLLLTAYLWKQHLAMGAGFIVANFWQSPTVTVPSAHFNLCQQVPTMKSHYLSLLYS